MPIFGIGSYFIAVNCVHNKLNTLINDNFFKLNYQTAVFIVVFRLFKLRKSAWYHQGCFIYVVLKKYDVIDLPDGR